MKITLPMQFSAIALFVLFVMSCKKESPSNNGSGTYGYLTGYWQGNFTDSIDYGMGILIDANNVGRIYFSTSGSYTGSTPDTANGNTIYFDGTWSVTNNTLNFSCPTIGVICTSNTLSSGQTTLPGTIAFSINAGTVSKGTYNFSLKRT
jgi:hypothetical protein